MNEDIIKELRVNRRIKAKEVRVIGGRGEQLGILPLPQALQLAEESNLDLVEVAATADPPVCRLLDYGKYKYEQTKKERKARKTSLLKEVRLRVKIGEADLEAKIRMVKRLLGEGDKVKISVIFRGREITHPALGWKVLQKVAEPLKEVAVVSSPPVAEGRNINLILSPASTKQAKEKIEVNAKT